jgi:Zn2+/Cd2+-exporting ATPase
MGCSCCNNEDICEIGGKGGIPGRHHDHESADGNRARLEIRILAVRFALSALLFAGGIVFSRFDGLVNIWLPRTFFVLSWLIAGYRVMYSALKNILRGDFFDENFLMSVATVGAFAIGQWTEGAAVMLFFNLGEMVQETAVSRSRKSITDLMDVRPDMARLADSGKETHPSAVPEGSLILVRPGEKVPLDGIVVDGSSSFDTSRLTGESLPREVLPGSDALAGFVNGRGSITIRTTASFADTAASKMLELIETAQGRKAKAEKFITSFAKVYTPIVTFGAVLLAVIPPVVLAVSGAVPITGWSTFGPWVSRALVFLVISCPCAFVISVPLGYFGGIGGAAKKGILVKGADYIDVLARAGAVVFDKTGTLTRGAFSVLSVHLSESARESGLGETELIRVAALAESRSNHPVALAIRSYAASLSIQIDPSAVADATELAGFGVSVTAEGNTLLAGSRKLMVSQHVSVSDMPDISGSSKVGTVVEIAKNGSCLGCFVLGDEAKADSAAAVRRLGTLGVTTIVMLTGDTESAAREIGRKIGIGEIHSGVLPHEKVAHFEEIQRRVGKENPRSTVLFVGDGINDAPVLARADAGLAMGGIGSDAAIEAADVVLMNDSPALVAEAIRSARWTRHIVKENIVLSFAIKIGFLALGAFGIATLWEAVFADVGVALLATANALRARR